MRLTRQQLQNDLDALRSNYHIVASASEKLQQRVQQAETALHAALVERDDWRSAFKLIMKLVK